MAAQTIIGLDLGFDSIKAVELAKVSNSVQLVSLGSIPTPPRGLLSDTPLDEQGMVDIIGKLLKSMNVKTKICNASLPESQVYTRVIEIPKLTPKELSSSVKWEAEQYIPLPIDQVNLDYAILDETTGDGKMQVLLVAAPLKLIEKYTRIMENAGLTLHTLETDAIATSRIIPKGIAKDANVLLVNLGSNATDICVIRRGVLSFVRTVPTGGNSFTRAISEELGFSPGQAEEYKRTYGLEKDKLEGKIYTSIQPVFNTIVDDMKKTISFFKQRYPTEQIASIVVTGGSARLPGLVSYIASETGSETLVGNSFEGIVVDPKIKPQVDANASTFSIAVGLALKEFI